jgi:hypothetical protein
LMIKMLGWTETISSTDLVMWAKTDQEPFRGDRESKVKQGLQGYIRFRQ